MARIHFLAMYGVMAPPSTVGSLPTITHSTPAITPMPTTKPPPTVYEESYPARGLISRNGLSGSRTWPMRSRIGILSRERMRSMASGPPPASASSSSSPTTSRCSSMSARFRANASAPVSRLEGRGGARSCWSTGSTLEE